MSAAATALVLEAPLYFEAPNLVEPAANKAIGELVHDLRQPLSSIEAIAYYLEMTLPADQCEARQQMRRLQQLVYQAESVLGQAICSSRKPAASAEVAGVI